MDGVSRDSSAPVHFGPEENVVWRVPLAGPAGATPVVWGDHIFLTSARGEDLLLECISTDGEPLWTRKVDAGNRNVRGDEGNSAELKKLLADMEAQIAEDNGGIFR